MIKLRSCTNIMNTYAFIYLYAFYNNNMYTNYFLLFYLYIFLTGTELVCNFFLKRCEISTKKDSRGGTRMQHYD